MISSILLSAGLSTRMGEPKALLDWGGQPLVCYQVEQLHEAGADEVVVVLGHRADDIQRMMRSVKCRVMLNALYQMGRAGSLRIGAKAVNRDAEAIIILNIDQPRPAEFIRAVLEAHRAGTATITAPEHGGHRGHPLVVSGSLREDLMGARDETDGLHGVLRARQRETSTFETDDMAHLDVNTPEEYQAARARFGLS